MPFIMVLAVIIWPNGVCVADYTKEQNTISISAIIKAHEVCQMIYEGINHATAIPAALYHVPK